MTSALLGEHLRSRTHAGERDPDEHEQGRAEAYRDRADQGDRARDRSGDREGEQRERREGLEVLAGERAEEALDDEVGGDGGQDGEHREHRQVPPDGPQAQQDRGGGRDDDRADGQRPTASRFTAGMSQHEPPRAGARRRTAGAVFPLSASAWDGSPPGLATLTCVIRKGASTVDLSSIGAEPLEAGDPRRIGSFAITAVLGSGGMGRVYLGAAATGYAAVKQVLPYLCNDKTFLRHFGQELDNQARLPAGVSARLLAADRTTLPPWFATEYIPGVTLHDAVHLNGGSLPIETLWVLLRELAVRLKAIAALDMVHRDLKPSNVMLTGSGVTLIDFGIARAADQSKVTATGMVVGTPAYMAPEQARAVKGLTPALDVFSLGGLIAFAATGEPPFGETAGTDQLFRIVHEPPDLAALREVDGELADAVESCLAKDPADRPSAAEILEIAERRAVSGPPWWPSPIAARISVRAAFAATPPPGSAEGDEVTEFEETALEAEMPTGSDEADHPDGPEVPEAPDGADEPAGSAVPAAGGIAGVLAAERLASDSAADGSAEVEAVPLIARPAESAKRTTSRSRKSLVLLAALLLLACGAGTLVAMHDVPFIDSAGKDNGGGDKTLVGAGATSSASSQAAASASASGLPTAKASGSSGPSHKPGSSSSGSAAAGGGGTTSGGSTGGNGGAGTSTTGGGSSQTTAAGSGGGSTGSGGSGGSSGAGGGDATVVSTSYGEIKNVGEGVCVSGDYGYGSQSCDGQSDTAFREVAVSGGFELVSESSGLCLTDNQSSDAYASDCSSSSSQIWTVGARTSRGGELVNNGLCMGYSNYTLGSLGMESCDSSDSGDLWYDAGA
jgi:hypothetical protein